MFQRSHILVGMLCLASLWGGAGGCAHRASPIPRSVEPTREVRGDPAGEPVLIEDGP